MTALTPADLDAARQLVRRRAELTAELARLRPRRDALAATHERWRTHVNARTNYRDDPNQLAGLAELYQSVPPRFRGSIQFNYRWLLRDMIDPLPSLEPGAFAPKPRKVDFAALALAARPYLVGPYLGIHLGGRFAEVDLAASTPPHQFVFCQTGGPVDVEQWRSRTDVLSAWLSDGAASQAGQWTVTAHTATTVTLTRQPSLPALLPFTPAYLTRGALFAGIDVVRRTPVHIPFAELPAGTYIPGVSGTGKTSALHILLRSLFANLELFAAVYLVDGKDGVALQRYARLHPKVQVLYDEPDLWQLAADLVDLMRARNAAQRTMGTDKATRDFIAVVIDELPTFVAKPAKADRPAHEAFLDNLQKIAMRGRSAGIRMFLITQTPVAEQIPVTLRANCANTIAFRLPEQAHATSLFGTLSSANDPRKLPTGQAIVAQGESGKLTRVQFPFAPLYQPARFAP